MSELDTFVATVSKMRTAQKKYFSNRTQSNLKAALDLEADVDRQLLQMAPNKPAVADQLATQTRLFG